MRLILSFHGGCGDIGDVQMRFSTRTLLLAITSLADWMGYQADRAQRQQRATTLSLPKFFVRLTRIIHEDRSESVHE
ncbi:MAG: hypothetical protein ACI9G1_001637 [Pirellulaceae bacterium]